MQKLKGSTSLTKVKYPLATWIECKFGEVLLRILLYVHRRPSFLKDLNVVMSNVGGLLWTLCLIGRTHVLDDEQIGRAYAITLREERELAFTLTSYNMCMTNLLGPTFPANDARGVMLSCIRNVEYLVKMAAKLWAYNARGALLHPWQLKMKRNSSRRNWLCTCLTAVRVARDRRLFCYTWKQPPSSLKDPLSVAMTKPD